MRIVESSQSGIDDAKSSTDYRPTLSSSSSSSSYTSSFTRLIASTITV